MAKPKSSYAEKFNRKLLKQVKITRNNHKRNPNPVIKNVNRNTRRTG